MYRMFNSHVAVTNRYSPYEMPDILKRSSDQERPRGEVGINNNQINESDSPRKPGLVRSLSYDSYSTITTAAETHDNARNMSILWDGSLPVQISVRLDPENMRFGPLQKPRDIPERSLFKGDSGDDVTNDMNNQELLGSLTGTEAETEVAKTNVHNISNNVDERSSHDVVSTTISSESETQQASPSPRAYPSRTLHRTPSGGMDHLGALPQRVTRFEIERFTRFEI